ncbi:MAG: SpoIID/LytB domain-containing protein [Rikenellaceae bacterium]|nr:SpoIID/LytB domain-containing protein [Rikenellaceae bacterium]
MTEPEVSVGIMFEPQIEFGLNTAFVCNGKDVEGSRVVKFAEGKIEWMGEAYEELLFEPKDIKRASFELRNVTIGINFHWERKENQTFRGALKFIVEDNKITAINLLGIEEYLTSVISSEMSATASLELLKAHAVISRSWLMAQIQKNKEIAKSEQKYSTMHETPKELIKWYDREDHTRFDICADDHCQRYQGITRASTEIVKEAINQTRGQLLMYDGRICDARYSKSCGGIFEEFGNCWENVNHPYLVKKRDSKTNTDMMDLTVELNAREWILSSPEAFCNTTDKKILSQVLNNYDQETTNFYRWSVTYKQKELSALILKRSGVDYGEILDLVPVQRGTSGRLVKLKIVGTKRTRTIGKELEIRRTLSESHLYSSAFIIVKLDMNSKGVPGRFVLKGAGWGHGVGLCQIGAAVMGERGYKYDEILLHYFVGASIEKKY